MAKAFQQSGLALTAFGAPLSGNDAKDALTYRYKRTHFDENQDYHHYYFHHLLSLHSFCPILLHLSGTTVITLKLLFTVWSD